MLQELDRIFLDQLQQLLFLGEVCAVQDVQNIGAFYLENQSRERVYDRAYFVEIENDCGVGFSRIVVDSQGDFAVLMMNAFRNEEELQVGPEDLHRHSIDALLEGVGNAQVERELEELVFDGRKHFLGGVFDVLVYRSNVDRNHLPGFGAFVASRDVFLEDLQVHLLGLVDGQEFDGVLIGVLLCLSFLVQDFEAAGGDLDDFFDAVAEKGKLVGREVSEDFFFLMKKHI